MISPQEKLILSKVRGKCHLAFSCFSPPVFIEPGERTGTYRLGVDQLVMNAQGESRISAEDYAAALLDEIFL